MGICTVFVHIYRKMRFMSALRGEVSAVGEHSCKNGYLHRNKRFPGLRSKVCSIVPVRPAKYVATPPHPAPPPAPCLHLTHPVFNPVSPTTHSLNASVARGDTNNYCKLLQGRYCKVMVKSSTQRILYRRNQCRMIICGQGRQSKRWTKQLSIGNGKVMES